MHAELPGTMPNFLTIGMMREPLLNTTQLQRSLHVLGDARSSVWNRLDAGLPVTMGVLGASVAMNGGCQLEHQPELRCADFDGSSRRRKWAYGRDDSTGRAVRGFALQALDWVNATWPHAGHRVHNVAVDATKAEHQEQCVLGKLPLDVDLVLMEYGSVHSDPAAVERIMRRLLRFPRSPALVMLTVRDWCTCWAQLACRREPKWNTEWGHGSEDAFAALCKHYGATCVSMRDAIFHEVMSKARGFSIGEVAADCTHPSTGTVGYHLVADAVNHGLASLVERHRKGGQLQWAVSRPLLPRPYHEVNRRVSESLWSCHELHPVALRPRPLLPGERPPIKSHRMHLKPLYVEGTAGTPTQETESCQVLRTCLSAAATAEERRRCAHTHPGWQWCRRTLSRSAKKKPGIVAVTPGASMRLVVDTRLGVAGSSGPAAVDRLSMPASGKQPLCAADGCATVVLNYLSSYEGMGVCLVSCVSGCRCDEQRIDAHAVASFGALKRNASITQQAAFVATATPTCVLNLTVADATSSGEHKFKLLPLVSVGRALRRRGKGIME